MNRKLRGFAIWTLAIILSAGNWLFGPADVVHGAVQPAEKYVKVAAAESFAAGLTNQGNVYVWGNAAWSGTGSAYGGERPIKVPLPQNKSVTDIDAGRDAVYFLMSDKTVMALGANWTGQAGSGRDVEDEPVPVQVMVGENTPLGNVTKISAGLNHVLALKADKTVWVWGGEEYGYALGIPGKSVSYYATPVKAAGGGDLCDIVDIVAGRDFNMAISADGKLYTWGRDHFGQLANGTGENNENEATVVAGIQPKKVYAGSLGQHAFYTTVTGAVYGWGQNANGQVEPGGDDSFSKPVELDLSAIGTQEVKDIRAGYNHTLILTEDGQVFGMGSSELGQLTEAFGSTLFRLDPGLLNDIQSIEAGYKTSYAITGDGTVYAFGLNDNLQLGAVNKTNYVVWSPAQVYEPGTYTVPVAGTVTNLYTNDPVPGIDLAIVHDTYGTLYARTGLDGTYRFDVLPDTMYSIMTDENREFAYQIDGQLVYVPSDDPEEGITANLTARPIWVPDELIVEDTDETEGYMTGRAYWNVPNGGRLEKPVYRLYFETLDGEKLEDVMIGESYHDPDLDVYSHFIQFSDVPIPEEAAYVRLYVTSLESGEECYELECVLPARTAFFDGPMRSAVINGGEYAYDGQSSLYRVTFSAAQDETGIAGYELIQLLDHDSGGPYTFEVLDYFPNGESSHTADVVMGQSFNPDLLIVRVVETQASPNDPPILSGDWIDILFVDEDETEGTLSGMLVWEVNNISLSKPVYKAYFESAYGFDREFAGMAEYSELENTYYPYIIFNDVEIPAGMEYIRLYVYSQDPGDACYIQECALPLTVPVLDGPDKTAKMDGFEVDEDGVHVAFHPADNEEGIIGYEAVYVKPVGYRVTFQSLGMLPAGREYYEMVYSEPGFDQQTWISDLVRIRPIHVNDHIYSHRVKNWIMDGRQDRFMVQDIVRFAGNRAFDLTGDGLFDNEDLHQLLEFVEPIYEHAMLLP